MGLVGEFQVFRLNGETRRDVVANGLKPAKLIGAELHAGALLLAEPRGKARIDLGAARFKLRPLLESKADKVDQVGSYFRPAAAYVRRVQALVGAPELVGDKAWAAVDWLLNQRGQRLDLLERFFSAFGLRFLMLRELSGLAKANRL